MGNPLGTIKSLLRRARVDRRDRFLSDACGVVHVGAHVGQERDTYAAFGLPVVWVEPLDAHFEQLLANLEGYPDQRAVQALVTDQDGQEYTFHVASNRGASSSILDFKAHAELWPHVQWERELQLRSVTLPALFESQQIDAARYDTLVLDTQGSELLVLRGALPMLNGFRFVKTEVADFEAYEGCCQLADLLDFMRQQGFEERARHPFATLPQGGGYYDVIFRRKDF